MSADAAVESPHVGQFLKSPPLAHPREAEPARDILVRSKERLEHERGQRLRAMAEVREQLEALAALVKPGRLKAPANIGAAARLNAA
jgi:hypothetical protein